jgi:hypothetical protein
MLLSHWGNSSNDSGYLALARALRCVLAGDPIMRPIYALLFPLLALTACAGNQPKQRVALTPNMLHFMNKDRAPASVTTQPRRVYSTKKFVPAAATMPLPAPRMER